MLNTMRSLSKSIVSKLLMVLLVASFGLWGVGDMLRGGGPGYAAKVGGETIGVHEFQQQRSLVARQLEALGMKDLPAGKLEISVIRQLVQQKLTLMAMQDMGLFASDAQISKAIAAMPEFKDKDGKFSGQKFTTALANQGMSEASFVGQMKRDIAGRFLDESLNMKDSTPPASILALDRLSNGETRDAALLTITAGTAANTADEAALTAFYEEHKEAYYLNPESRTLEYVVLTSQNINDVIGIAIEDKVTEAGKDNPNKPDIDTSNAWRSEAREHLIRTLNNTVEDELAAGKTIGEAFKKAGITVDPHTLTATADMAKTISNDITKTVVEQGFGLSEGEISRLITTQDNHLLMVSVKKITPATPKAFDAVKADVQARLAKQTARDAARSKAQTVKAALAASPNWQAVAADNHLASRMVSRIARPVEGKQATDVGNLPGALQQALFEHKVGEVAGPLTLENGDQILAVITASHLPEISAMPASDKDRAAARENLSRDVMNRAYDSFTARHPVTVNPALLRGQATEE